MRTGMMADLCSTQPVAHRYAVRGLRSLLVNIKTLKLFPFVHTAIAALQKNKIVSVPTKMKL